MQRLAALIWVRSRIWWHGLRSHATKGDAAVAVILAALGAVFSALLAFVLAVMTYASFEEGSGEAIHLALLITFWMVGFFAVVVPIFFGIGRPQVPLRRLLVFPFSRWNLYRISLGSSFVSGASLFWYPTLAAVTLVAILRADVPALQWLVLVTLLAVCLVVWFHTVLAGVQSVLRKRSIRELAALIVLVVVVVVSMLPVMYEERAEEQGQDWFGELVPSAVMSSISRIAAVFPPSISVQGLEAIVFDGPGFPSSLVWLIVWTLAGATIGCAIVRRNLLEGDRGTDSGSMTGVKTNRIMSRWSIDRLTMLPLDVRAVAAKELLYLVRSTTGKFNIVITPILVIVMALLAARDVEHAILGLDRTSLVFVGLMIYASMLSVNFLFNAFAWEGAGVQSFFLCPVSPERIVLGKNLGTWLYSLGLGIESLVIFVLVSGMPPVSALVGGFLAFVAAVFSATLVGNFLSPIMPVPRDISSITNSPSQTAVLATFGVMIANVLVIGAMMTLPAVMGVSWLGPVLLLVLIAVETAIYVAMLRPAGRLLDRCRESLIEALQV